MSHLTVNTSTTTHAHTQECREAETLIARLPHPEAARVRALWDALLVARRDCEAMAARGVRVSRDVSRDWQETVSDLIDRVVAQDSEISSLKSQLKAAQAAAAQAAGMAPAAPVEDLQAQMARLKRHRDRLAKDNQELVTAVGKAQAAAEGAAAEAAAAHSTLEGVRTKAVALWQQHTELLRHHIDTAAYAQQLEAELGRWRSQPSSWGGAPPSALRMLLPAATHNSATTARSSSTGMASIISAAATEAATEAVAAAEPDVAEPVAAIPIASQGRRATANPGALAKASPRSFNLAFDAAAPATNASPRLAGKLGKDAASAGGGAPLAGGGGGDVAGGDRRAERFNSQDHLADDQAPLHAPDAAAPQQGAMCGAALGGRSSLGQLHFGSARSGGEEGFDWRDDIETCKQQLEALTALFVV